MSSRAIHRIDRRALDELYAAYNRRAYVHPDPLEFLYGYEDIRDREIVGLIASSLAYGQVRQILRSIPALLGLIHKPFDYLMASTERSMSKHFAGFKHRFTTGSDMARLLAGARRAIESHGSLNRCFLRGLARTDKTILPALSAFVAELSAVGPIAKGLLPRPEMGSACKRLNLFLRWMVRRDDVDPGGWEGVPPSKLIVPLDTHMHRIGIALGFTKRKAADMRTAVEITKAYSAFAPDDPVKYDFSLTRFGIRDDLNGHKALANRLGIGYERAP